MIYPNAAGRCPRDAAAGGEVVVTSSPTLSSMEAVYDPKS